MTSQEDDHEDDDLEERVRHRNPDLAGVTDPVPRGLREHGPRDDPDGALLVGPAASQVLDGEPDPPVHPLHLRAGIEHRVRLSVCRRTHTGSVRLHAHVAA